ncbi:MAG: substrate-binding domain-containing protein [Hydrogenophaga sp.]|uniref:substrate-binding domain-containing protein n=2 Tax=Hydrogenophaga sp. TaxID=1904254 RepID=UPI0025C0B1C5|nr:substrate-binding domain-containing protein [Hydrogenophaga sp.]
MTTETNPTLRGISSMATRQVLADLGAAFEQRTGCRVAIESVGGVDAARRVAAGEAFDVVILASDAIDRLIAAGHLRAGSRVDLVRSGVAIAVRAGAPVPDVSSEAALQQAVRNARSISYSTGPSGVALAQLFERWGMADEVRGRTVKAPPGVPVGTLVARGDVALGFQQLSELIHVEGITLVGGMPAGVEILTVFSAGLPVGLAEGSPQAARVRDLLNFMTSPDAEAAKRRQGMDPA